MLRRSSSSLLAAAMVVALAACAQATDDGVATPSGGTALGDGHGRIAGAEEVAEPQLHLLTVDEAGSVSHLDLLDESVDDLGDLDAVDGLVTDGRYGYAVRPEADAVTVIDSGVWTWSHVDHFHYYRAEASVLGDVAGDGRATVSANDAGAGILFPASGEAVVLGADTLADGSLDERFRIEVTPHEGLVVPVGERALVTEPGADGIASRLRALDRAGAPLDAADCPEARGTITTVVGVVVGCRDGALLTTIDEHGAIAFEHIPYPTGANAEPAREFRARAGRPTVAAVGGSSAIWLLDTRERAWTLLDAGEPIVQASAVDDAEQHVLALTQDGRVLVLSGATGERLAATAQLVPASTADPQMVGVELIADQHRAYLNGPTEHRLFEIDFADGARVARTFATPGEPRFLVETGR